MISIYLENERIEVERNVSLATLLLQKNMQKKICAVALNDAFVPVSQYEQTVLQENDRIEIIIPMQGG